MIPVDVWTFPVTYNSTNLLQFDPYRLSCFFQDLLGQNLKEKKMVVLFRCVFCHSNFVRSQRLRKYFRTFESFVGPGSWGQGLGPGPRRAWAAALPHPPPQQPRSAWARAWPLDPTQVSPARTVERVVLDISGGVDTNCVGFSGGGRG